MHRSFKLGLLLWLLGFVGTAGLHAQDPLPPPPDGPEPPLVFDLVVPQNFRVAVCPGEASVGVPVFFPSPRVVTDCEDRGRVICVPESGSVFPVGTTEVRCEVTTGCGEQVVRTFQIEVVPDNAPPVLVCPEDVVAYASRREGVIVDYPIPEVSDDADDAVDVVCEPPPGSLFPVGITEVLCTAVDVCGNEVSCRFQVEVLPATLDWRPTFAVDPATGRERFALTVQAQGMDSVEMAESLDGDWNRVPLVSLEDPLIGPGDRFVRPPMTGGMPDILSGAPGEVAYVQVGLLPAYFTPGINPARIAADNSDDFAVEILNGLSGGSGENRWSVEVNLPWTVRFFGRPYKKCRVSKNGLLTFSTDIVTRREGLDYFDFPDPGTDATATRLTNALPLWNAGFSVENTIFCMAGRHIPQTAANKVIGRIHGTAPYRKLWFIFRHPKDTHGNTVTGIVLEETTNRILLMDMFAENPGGAATRLLAGFQGELNSAREVRQVPATPAVRLAGRNNGIGDNGCYLFRPYLLGGPVTGQASTAITSAVDLDSMIQERMRAENIPGLSVAITRNGRLIFSKGYGFANVETSEFMRPFHRTCIGSVSKIIAAFGVAKLIQDGRLNGLNDRAYSSNLLGQDWFWESVQTGLNANIHAPLMGIGSVGSNNVMGVLTNITIRHLLSHTAALGNVNDDAGAAAAYADGNYEELLPRHHVQRFMATQPFATNALGILSSYSNPGYKHIGVLIEIAARAPFEPWMIQHLMIPGGASTARLMRTYEWEETWRDARRYHFYNSGAPWVRSRITGEWGPRPYGDAIYANAADGAAGSWTASSVDLVRLLAAMDQLSNKPDILDPERVLELEQRAFPDTLSNNPNQGIGWDRVNLDAGWVQKNGNIGYGSAQVRRATTPDRLTVAVVINSGIGNVTQLTADIFNAVRPLTPPSPMYDLFPGEKVSQ